jgi:hypothetical protein
MRVRLAIVCAVLSSSCASSLKPVYVVPDAVSIQGEGLEYPNTSAQNVVTFSSGLPMMGRELTLTCADGQTETVFLTNDGIDPIGLVSTVVLGVLTVGNVASAARSEGIGDQVYYGTLAGLTGSIGLFTFLTSWQPSRPVTVNHPGSVCKTTTPTAPAAATPDEAAPPAPLTPPAEAPPTPAAPASASPEA